MGRMPSTCELPASPCSVPMAKAACVCRSCARGSSCRKDSVLEAIKAGVDNYIVKPFTPDNLQKAIEKAKAKAGR